RGWVEPSASVARMTLASDVSRTARRAPLRGTRGSAAAILLVALTATAPAARACCGLDVGARPPRDSLALRGGVPEQITRAESPATEADPRVADESRCLRFS